IVGTWHETVQQESMISPQRRFERGKITKAGRDAVFNLGGRRHLARPFDNSARRSGSDGQVVNGCRALGDEYSRVIEQDEIILSGIGDGGIWIHVTDHDISTVVGGGIGPLSHDNTIELPGEHPVDLAQLDLDPMFARAAGGFECWAWE